MRMKVDVTITYKFDNQSTKIRDVINSYQKGLLYIIDRREGDTIKIPIENIWLIREEYEEI